MALALYGAIGRVFIVTELRKASVPSEPTRRWAMMSNGSSKVTSGRRFSPVTFLMEYLYFILSVSS